ncbi:hypothetical protein EON83_00940 [bacterium]|nr:MAG: hypothetical protein EON83_00940 [bacterium]
MRFPAVWLGVLLVAALPVHAQLPRVEGTITQSGDSTPLRANVSFQPPDSLKVEVLGADDQVTQTVVASGDQTQTFDSRTKRLTVIKANIVREWYRSASLLYGGPANFAFSGATGFTAEPTQGISRIRDRTLLGTSENRTYYVASKKRVRAFPARIEIKEGVRTDFNDQNLPVLHAKITSDAQKMPQRADVGTVGNMLSFAYALKARDTEFPANTFSLPEAAKDAIHEDTVLRAPSSYTGTTPDDQWNRGVALWRASGDSGEALAAWARVTLENPRATAPRFSTLEVSLATRTLGGATRALEGLKPLLSESDYALASASVANLRSDQAAVLRDLQTAAKTGEPERLLALSMAQRSSGDINAARATWKALLTPTTPRAFAIKAAESFALSATRAEFATLGQTLEGDGEAVQLARALLDVRGGKTPTTTFPSLLFRASFARALERAGQGGVAKPLWESLESNETVAIQNEARSHLISILARSGDASGALTFWGRWNATLLFDTEKQKAQNILFDAFQKAGKSDALRVLLLNRATANAAKDPDLRLSLAYQETFGSDTDVNNAITAGFNRFPNAPFWQGKRAESYVSQGFMMTPSDTAGFRRRAQTFKAASDLLDKAIAGDDDPTFYTLQKALISIQRATDSGGVVDAIDLANSIDEARIQLAKLDASNDPDYNVVATIGWNAFPAPEDRAKTIGSGRHALDSAPNDGDRSTPIFAVRQAMSRVYETAGDAATSTKQWVMLIDISRSADEEAGLIAALINAMESRKNVTGIAQLMVRVGSEHWPLDANAALLGGATARAAASPLSNEISQALDALADAPNTNTATYGAIIARAAFSLGRLQRATAIIAIPGAPPTADAELERATRALPLALAALKPLADSDDPFWSTRARLLLLDSGTLAPDDRLDLLKKLAATQGGEPSVVLVRANAETDPQARVAAAQTLDFRVATWRRLALDAIQKGDKEGAEFWSREAFEFASTAPEVDSEEFQRVSFAHARVLWATGQIPTATTIYNNLAGPGWANIGRASALLALRKRLQEAGRADEAKAIDTRIAALNLTKNDAQNALSLLADLDG